MESKNEKIIDRINYFIFRAKVASEDSRRAAMQSNRKAELLATETRNNFESAALNLAKQYALLDHDHLHFS
jgi:hypothetical protein